MKVLCLLGSPRPDGNSTAIAQRFCATAKGLGAETEAIRLADLEFSGCRTAWLCKTTLEHCGLEDALGPVLAAVHDADVLVLATPVCFTDVAWPLKACIDRFFSFLAPGKMLVFILVQGEPEQHCADIFPRYERPFAMLGFDQRHLIRACGLRQIGEAEARADIMELAEKTAAGVLV